MENSLENLLKTEAKKIKPPSKHTILQEVRRHTEWQECVPVKTPLRFSFSALAKFAAAAVSVVCVVMLVYIVSIVVETPIDTPAGIGDAPRDLPQVVLIPVDDDIVIDTDRDILDGYFLVSNGLGQSGIWGGVFMGEDWRTAPENINNPRRYGIINTAGEIVIPIEYLSLASGFSDGLASAAKIIDGEVHLLFIDNENNIVSGGTDGELLWDYRIRHTFDGTMMQPVPHHVNLAGQTRIALGPSPHWALFYRIEIDGDITLFHDTSRDMYTGFYGIPLHTISWSAPEAIRVYTGSRYGTLNLADNAFTTEPIFSAITPFSNGRAIVALAENEHVNNIAIIDNKGSVLVNLSSEVYPRFINRRTLNGFSDVNGVGYAPLHFWGVFHSPLIVNMYGEIIAETEGINRILSFNNEGIAIFEQNDKFGYINIYGQILHPAEFEFATNIYDGVGFVRKGGQGYRIVIG